MKPFARVFTLILTTIAITFSSSCVPNISVSSAKVSEPVLTAPASINATAIPSEAPTETPTPSLTPEEQKTLLNQQIQDFLNRTGEYTVEKMNCLPIYGSRFCYEDGNGSDLGILRIFNQKSDSIDKYVAVYGFLFEVVEKNNDIVLTIGFDGRYGTRFVTPLMVIGDAYDEDGNGNDFVFSFSTEEGYHLDDKHVRQLLACNSDAIFDNLCGLKGERVVVDIPAKKASLEGKNTGSRIFWEGSNSRIPYTFNLISRLANNGIDTSAIGSSGKDIPLIYSSDDLNNVDCDSIPIIISIRYRENG